MKASEEIFLAHKAAQSLLRFSDSTYSSLLPKWSYWGTCMLGMKNIVSVSLSERLIATSCMSCFSVSDFSVLAFSASFFFASSSSEVSSKLEVPLYQDSVTSLATVLALESLTLSFVASEPGWSIEVKKFKFCLLVFSVSSFLSSLFRFTMSVFGVILTSTPFAFVFQRLSSGFLL